ncbi:MAG: Gfo/Idh/MocA family oxidoreductase [Planctomycetes bacterium]|nr:Gfo/Idh/MocA family oxidoreductase [Planctomycetota bacterium]
MTPLRLGFVGLGHISTKAHLPGLLPLVSRGEVVLQAFCDSDEKAISEKAREFGVTRFYTDHREMIEREPLDALYVTIPPTFHTDAELLAAQKGIGLFVEKPQTLDIRQAVQFESAVRRAGIVSVAGFMMRYYPAAERMRELVSQRRPRHANLQFFYTGAPVRHWTNRMELCGGSFVENTIHMVDLLRYFLQDDYQAVSAFYLDRPFDPDPKAINLPHVYNVNYRFRAGVVANVTTSRVLTRTHAHRWQMVVVCDDSLIEYAHDRIVENGEVVWQAAGPANPFALQAEGFVAAVRARDPARVKSPYPGALNSLAAVLGANASAVRGGQVIDLEAFCAGT